MSALRSWTRPARARALHDDDGAATVLVIALCAVLCVVTMVVLALGVLTVTRHRAEAAADLAALSAARHALEGSAAACEVARAAAVQHGTRLARCEVTSLDVVVTVALAPPGRLGRYGELRATARAGAR